MAGETDDEGTTKEMIPRSTSSTEMLRAGSGNDNQPRWAERDEDASTVTSSSSSCSCLLVLRLLDMLLLLGLCIAQGSLLNFLIIWHLQRSHVVYLWFLADFVVVMGFVGALTTSYQRVARIFFGRSSKGSSPLKSPENASYGSLPLGYLSWLLYAGVLVAKIVVIFKFSIADRLGDEQLFTPQLLKVVLGGGASLIFLLLVNAHRPPSHPDDDSRAYLASLCTGTAFEIFDAVAFLELLFVMETRLILPFPLETAVLVLSSVNLLLPALPLFRLSLSDFGRRPRPAALGLVYSTIKLLVIECPYLGIRVYLWSFFGASTSSIFMLKNLLMIVVKLRYVIPEYVSLLVQRRARRKRVEDAPPSSTITRTSHLEMSTIS